MTNHYETLGVREDATELEIRTAYRELSKLHHPDRNNGSDEAHLLQLAINRARDVLCDAASRAEHDRELSAARAAEEFRRRPQVTYDTVMQDRSTSRDSSSGWLAAVAVVGVLGVLAATSNKKDAKGRFHGRDGRYRSRRWGK